MRLLRITADGLPLFSGKADLTFYARERVSENDRFRLQKLFSNVWANPVSLLIGINASGKTSVLKLILLALGILRHEHINCLETRDILGSCGQVRINTWFYGEASREICRLETCIEPQEEISGKVRYIIREEKLWIKPASQAGSGKKLPDFDGVPPADVRDSGQAFLADDVSIMIAWNRKTGECIQTASVIGTSDTDLSHFPSDVPQASAAFLDPSIEYLRQEVEGCGRCIRLKFHGRNEIFLNNPSELGSFLSSGTIRGMILFSMAHRILSTGGCMAVDDLERSLNAEVAKTLVRLFEDGRINRKGGTLIFSAHSPEMLDEFDRRD